MVTQAKAPKLSSSTREAIAGALRQPTRIGSLNALLSVKNKYTQKDLLEHALYSERKLILMELANLHEDGLARFRRMWGRRFFRVDDKDLFLLRDQLRSFWESGRSLKEKEKILSMWCKWQPQGFARLGFLAWLPSIELGRLLPSHENLHAQTVQAVLEHAERLARCGNPDCPASYFIARRSDQKYCERGECTKYAQRMFSLDWWNREGSKRRAAKQKEGATTKGPRDRRGGKSSWPRR